MGRASATMDRLRQGQVVTLHPRGRSMAGRVNDGDVVAVEPLGARERHVGDVVLVRIHDREELHLVQAIQGNHYLIGNNPCGINGWVSHRAAAGIATQIAPAQH